MKRIIKPRTLNQLNKIIRDRFGDVFLTKGEGYFYLTSDDEDMKLKLASLWSTTILVPSINGQSIDAWLSDVKKIMSQIEE